MIGDCRISAALNYKYVSKLRAWKNRNDMEHVYITRRFLEKLCFKAQLRHSYISLSPEFEEANTDLCKWLLSAIGAAGICGSLTQSN